MFFAIAAAATLAAAISVAYARFRIRSGVQLHGVVDAIDDIGLPMTGPNPWTVRHNGYMRYTLRLETTAPTERVSINSYIPREVGDRVEIVYDAAKQKYAFTNDLLAPAVVLSIAALLSLVTGTLLILGPFA